jgi:hypothetical protein
MGRFSFLDIYSYRHLVEGELNNDEMIGREPIDAAMEE